MLGADLILRHYDPENEARAEGDSISNRLPSQVLWELSRCLPCAVGVLNRFSHFSIYCVAKEASSFLVRCNVVLDRE